MDALLVVDSNPISHDRIEKIALERGGVPLESAGQHRFLHYASVPAAVRSAFDLLAVDDLAATARIGIVVGDDRTLADRLVELASPGSVAVTSPVYEGLGSDAQRFTLLGERLFPNAGSTVRVYRSGWPTVAAGATADLDLRERLLELIRARGTRPTRAEAIRLLAIRSEAELKKLTTFEQRGLIRVEHDYRLQHDIYDTDGDVDDDEYLEERPRGHHHGRRSDHEVYDGPLGRLLRRNRDLDDTDLYELYRSTFERRLKRGRAGLAAHTSSFLGVNALIAVIWAVTTAPGFPWFLFPLLGWGIGYLSHRTAHRAREQEYAELLGKPGAGRRELRAHRKLWKVRRSWRGHLASNVATMVLLGTINIITGGGFPWALIPSAAMGIGLITHHARYRHQVREMLEEGGIETGPRRTGGTADGSGFLAEARAIQRRIEEEIAALPEAAALLGGDFQQVLANYVEQLEVLDHTQRDVRELIDGIAINELDREYARLESRLDRDPGSRLAAEYRTSLDQIEQQRRSYRELTSELEVLELRSGSALHALKQLRIDVVRTRNTRSQTDSIEDLRSRSLEISRYLEDLRAGYEELS